MAASKNRSSAVSSQDITKFFSPGKVVRTLHYKVAQRSPGIDDPDVAESQPMPETPVRSFAKSNLELSAAFSRYVSIRGFAAQTIEDYTETVSRFVASLGSASVVVADRSALRRFLGALLDRGCGPNTVRKQTCALRLFFKFLQQSRLTVQDPTAMLAHRALPRRLPRVLTRAEMDRLIAAAKTPFENAVLEFLYSTGVRVSELVSMKLEDVDLEQQKARVVCGKGQKDRIVLFGGPAVKAIQRLQEARPSRGGWLFEAPEQNGSVSLDGNYWDGTYYDAAGVQQYVYLGIKNAKYRGWKSVTREQARRQLDLTLKKVPGYKPKPPRPFTDRGIRTLVSRVARRARVGRVYPHSLRRAFATHMLEGGADLRVIQTLLGHTNVSTTALYTGLSSASLKETHTRCHPTAGGRDAEV